jgi:hypothetical protein
MRGVMKKLILSLALVIASRTTPSTLTIVDGEYGRAFAAEAASNPSCSGITISYWRFSKIGKKLKDIPGYHLMMMSPVSIHHGPSDLDGYLTRGGATEGITVRAPIPAIVNRVCAIVKGHGAQIE